MNTDQNADKNIDISKIESIEDALNKIVQSIV